jgi:hypothetical protein
MPPCERPCERRGGIDYRQDDRVPLLSHTAAKLRSANTSIGSQTAIRSAGSSRATRTEASRRYEMTRSATRDSIRQIWRA